jgi:hypothetical protein
VIAVVGRLWLLSHLHVRRECCCFLCLIIVEVVCSCLSDCELARPDEIRILSWLSSKSKLVVFVGRHAVVPAMSGNVCGVSKISIGRLWSDR